MRVDLICTGPVGALPAWRLGRVLAAGEQPSDIAMAVAAREPGADFVLFWDAALGAPNERTIRHILTIPGDVWHAGLALGMGGLPRLIDYVDPVWRFNRDPSPEIVATSWRLSLRACLARAAVLDRLGGPDPHFETAAGAALELGHRWIRRGALMRHVAGLLPDGAHSVEPPALPLVDEMRFLRLRYGRTWATWAAWRHWRNGGGLRETARALRQPQPSAEPTPATALHEWPGAADTEPTGAGPSVSILIPTLDRYPHLFNLLDQLRRQTVPPLEIVVVDQT